MQNMGYQPEYTGDPPRPPTTGSNVISPFGNMILSRPPMTVAELLSRNEEFIPKTAVLEAILSQPPDAHYPAWYAEQIASIQASPVRPAEAAWWEHTRLAGFNLPDCTCSACGLRVKQESLYCPGCGSFMVGGPQK